MGGTEYPRFMTSVTMERKIVNSEEEMMALGEGWYKTIAEAALGPEKVAKLQKLGDSVEAEALSMEAAALENSKELETPAAAETIEKPASAASDVVEPSAVEAVEEPKETTEKPAETTVKSKAAKPSK